MSGYILVIVGNSVASRVLSLFRSAETMALPLPQGRTLIYVSNSAALSGSSLFQGYAVDHAREAMVFAGATEASLPSAELPVEGSYFRAAITETDVRCSADLYGFVSMMWFADAEAAAVSDSWLSLISVRRALGLPCTPHEETVSGRMWSNSMAYQQLGRETYCQEIRYATPGTSLVFEHARGSVVEEPLDLMRLYAARVEHHSDAIEASVVRMVRAMKTYASTGGSIVLGLSGGTDSRLCLAAALIAEVGDALHVGCTNNGSPDYAVAVALSERFGFALNPPNRRVQGRLEENDVAAVWATTSMGVYDALYAPRMFRHLESPAFAVVDRGRRSRKATSDGVP